MLSECNDMKCRDINFIRELAVEETFREAIYKKALIMTQEFPFLVIGIIEDVEGDYVFIDVETTHIDPLEDKIFRIHLDRIEVFYIEEPGKPIPKISPSYYGKAKECDE